MTELLNEANPIHILIALIIVVILALIYWEVRKNRKQSAAITATDVLGVLKGASAAASSQSADAIKQAMAQAQDANAKAAAALGAIRDHAEEVKQAVADNLGQLHSDMSAKLDALKQHVTDTVGAIKPETHLHAKSISITAEPGRATDTPPAPAQPANGKPAG